MQEHGARGRSCGQGPRGRLVPALCLLLVTALGLGCGGRGGETTSPEEQLRPPRALTAFTPPDATSVLLLEPQQLLREAAWAGLVDVAFPADQRQSFERLFVIRPEEVREAAWVRWGDQGFVALLRGDFRGADAVRGLGMRMNTVEVTRDEPARRVGFLGTVRREALQLDEATFAYSGDAGPAMASVASLGAGGDADASASQAAVQQLEALLGPAPIRYLHLVPLAPPADTPLYLVLAQQRTLGVALREVAPDTLELHLVLTGSFPSTIEDNARAVLGQLFRSDLGQVLVGREAPPLQLEVREQSVHARVQLRASTLHSGLRTVFVDGLTDLFAAPSL